MDKEFKEERVKSLSEITARHEHREIEGCASWRHYAVHQDRAWLLSAIRKIRAQVEKIRQAESDNKGKISLDAEVSKLLGMFEEETLNHVGDK